MANRFLTKNKIDKSIDLTARSLAILTGAEKADILPDLEMLVGEVLGMVNREYHIGFEETGPEGVIEGEVAEEVPYAP